MISNRRKERKNSIRECILNLGDELIMMDEIFLRRVAGAQVISTDI
jgi:hypothetical protein